MLNSEQIKNIIINEYPRLASEYGVKRIGLFGSFAKGTQNEDSDIDIVAEFRKPVGLKFVEFTDYLEKILGRKVDVLTMAGIRAIRIEKIAKDIEKNIVYV